MRFLWLALTLGVVQSLDVSWIPADDGPLPLSAAYRQRLSKLCDVVDRVKPLPPSIVERLDDIQRMCAKLRRASEPGGGHLVKKLGLAAVVAAVAAVAGMDSWNNKGWLYKVVQDERARQRRLAQAQARLSSRYRPQTRSPRGKRTF
ncbi:hypothetical protein M885DRAFT_609815 [Pelagophyceae sp. CCMP2097]|nr:hypothetical protein M885DRAFT_609815 [Pelagophyceae sp. CCMP2097]